MDLNKEIIQREEFRNILLALAKSQECLEDKKYRYNMYLRLEALYDAPTKKERFRHFYSDIFSVLTRIQTDTSLGDINILGQNLDVIRKGYKPQNKAEDGRSIDIIDSINKLYDHVSLDIARILYSDAGDRKISGEQPLNDIKMKMKEIDVDIEEAKMFQRETEEKIRNQQREYIAILGIFAAVVLAFTAGIAFSSSVLDNISESSIYRIVVVSLIIGLVLINVLFALFFYINKLVNKDSKVKPIIISNIIIVLLIIATVFAWSFGVVESRNTRIYQEVQRMEEMDRI